jgi:tRNA (guanine37-N1)-methyltransferase
VGKTLVEERDTKIVAVPLENANYVLSKLKKLKIINHRFKITQKDGIIYIPITVNSIDNDDIRCKFTIIDKEHLNFSLQGKNIKIKPNLKEALQSKLPPEIHAKIPRSFDIIGNIVIIELNREEQADLHSFKKIIGQTILEINPHIKTVLEKYGDVEGIFRTRPLNYLAGKKTKSTIYKENNCKFKVNLEEVFFSPRLGHERGRVSLIETPFNNYGYVWDVFCGIGPFFIQIAKQYPKTKIIATDINPNAIKAAQFNINLNKLKNNILCSTQDVAFMASRIQDFKLENSISRIIMNLPEKNLDFLSILPPFLHPKGALLHIYQFNEKINPKIDALQKIEEKIVNLPLEIKKILNFRVVKPYSPAMDTTVLDLIIKRKEK